MRKTIARSFHWLLPLFVVAALPLLAAKPDAPQEPEHWRGTLTIGQHSYLWSNADFGGAHLVNTEPCASLAEAITALQAGIADFARVFSAV